MLAAILTFNPHKINFMNDAARFLKGQLYSGSFEDYSKGIGLTLGTGLRSTMSQQNKVIDTNLWNMLFKDGIAEYNISTKWSGKI